MKALLTSPINPISNSPYSHRSAQAEIYAQQIFNHANDEDLELVVNYGNKETDYDQYDRIFVYHGNDWSGVLNLFGGPDGLCDKEGLVKLLAHPEKIISLVIDMPDYAGLLRKRLKEGETFGNILDELPTQYEPTAVFGSPSFEGADNLVVGDSHAIALYRPGWEVLSVPFKTLHGALNGEGGLKKLIGDRFQHGRVFKEIEFYFGAIDIRHHLMRQPDPAAATQKLADDYLAQVESSFPGAYRLRIYEPLPIEDESRKLPKTGYYQGTPFYGTWFERDTIRTVFCNRLEEICANSAVEFVRWTDYLKNEQGQLSFDHMERPRSVHLARASYPFWKGFNPPPVVPKPIPETITTLENFFD